MPGRISPYMAGCTQFTHIISRMISRITKPIPMERCLGQMPYAAFRVKNDGFSFVIFLSLLLLRCYVNLFIFIMCSFIIQLIVYLYCYALFLFVCSFRLNYLHLYCFCLFNLLNLFICCHSLRRTPDWAPIMPCRVFSKRSYMRDILFFVLGIQDGNPDVNSIAESEWMVVRSVLGIQLHVPKRD